MFPKSIRCDFQENSMYISRPTKLQKQQNRHFLRDSPPLASITSTVTIQLVRGMIRVHFVEGIRIREDFVFPLTKTEN